MRWKSQPKENRDPDLGWVRRLCIRPRMCLGCDHWIAWESMMYHHRVNEGRHYLRCMPCYTIMLLAQEFNGQDILEPNEEGQWLDFFI